MGGDRRTALAFWLGSHGCVGWVTVMLGMKGAWGSCEVEIEILAR